MNAQEIIDELVSGKTVAILSDDAFEFMREVERHGISCEGITMSFQGGQCVMSIESYYCPEHKYNLLRYVDHQRGCTSYTNGPCTCGFENAMRDPAIAYDNSRRQ